MSFRLQIEKARSSPYWELRLRACTETGFSKWAFSTCKADICNLDDAKREYYKRQKRLIVRLKKDHMSALYPTPGGRR
jgi:hypothetical protein